MEQLLYSSNENENNAVGGSPQCSLAFLPRSLWLCVGADRVCEWESECKYDYCSLADPLQYTPHTP